MIDDDWPELAAEGSGSFYEIAAYIARVVEQNTTVNADATAERLGRSIAASVLNRLRDTSDLVVRADELTAAHDVGYRKAQAKYGHVGSLQDAVADALAQLRAAVAELSANTPTRRTPLPKSGRQT